jgi:hypothetical protein
MERGSGANAGSPNLVINKLWLIPEKEYSENLKIGEENL